jgi:O-antigen/teichoic acid export membrane protein/O-antigen ligase
VTDARANETTVVGGIARQTSAILAARAFAAGCTAILTVALARTLGPDAFGRYALALTVATVAGLAAELGVGSATARFAAERLARDAPIGRLLRESFTTKAAIAFAAFAVMTALAGPIAGALQEPRLASLIRVAAAGVVFADFFGWLAAIFEATRSARRQVVMIAVKATTEVAAVLVLVAGIGAGALGAIAGNAFAFAVAALAGIAMLRRAVSPAPVADGTGRRRLIGYGVHVWVASVAWLGFDRIDQIMLGVMRDPVAVAQYEAPWRLIAVLSLTTTALAAVVGPRLVGVDTVLAGRLVADALRVALVIGVPLATLILVIADDLVATLFGSRFEDSATVLRWLTPFIVLVGFAPIASRALDYLGAARSRVWIAITTLALNLVLDLLLIPWLGLIGPAIATTIAAGVFVGGHLVLLARHVVLPWAAVRRSVMTTVRVAAGTAVATLPSRLLPTAPSRLLVGLALGVAAAGILTLRAGIVPVAFPRLPRPRPRFARQATFVATCLAAGIAAYVVLQAPVTAAAALIALVVAFLLVREPAHGLAAFIVIAPLTQLPSLGGVSGQLAKVAGGLIALAWIVAVVARRTRVPHGVHGPLILLLAFLVWAAMSYAWAEAPDDTLVALGRWLPVVLLFLIASSTFASPGAVRLGAAAMAASGAVGVVASFGAGGSFVEGRLAGALGDPNIQGAALVPAILLAAALCATSSGSRRIGWFAVALLNGAGLIATGSRGAIVGLVIGVVTMLVIAGTARGATARVTVAAVCVTAVAFVAVVPADMRARFATLDDVAATDGGTGRTDLWRIGAREFADHPVEGVGLGNFSFTAAGQLDEPGLIRRADLVVGEAKVTHNTYLHVLAETGMIGLALFVGAVALSLGMLGRAVAAGAADARTRLLLRAIFAGTAGLLGSDAFISGQYENELWIMLGLCVAGAGAVALPVRPRFRRPAAGWAQQLAGAPR